MRRSFAAPRRRIASDTCNAIADPYQSCVTFPDEGELSFYRRRYYDLRTDEWINNVCSTETRSIAAESLPEVDQSTIVVRRSVQLNDEELLELEEGSSTHSGMVELTYCQGYLCNDVDIHDGSNHEVGNSCFYCKVSANETESRKSAALTMSASPRRPSSATRSSVTQITSRPISKFWPNVPHLSRQASRRRSLIFPPVMIP